MQKYIYGFYNEKIDYTQEKGWQGNPHGCQEAESILQIHRHGKVSSKLSGSLFS
jgi:hypothetical protein